MDNQQTYNKELWHYLQLTTKVIWQVNLGRSLNTALESIAPIDKPSVQALSFSVLRNWGMANAIFTHLVNKKTFEPLACLLKVSLALLSLPADKACYTSHTLVDQTVKAAKKNRRTNAGSGFINACLRRYLREAQAIQQLVAQQPVAQYNHPQWWLELLQQDYPHQWQQIALANLTKAALFLRVNQRKVSVPQYIELLQQQGIAAQPISEVGIKLEQAVKVEKLPYFEQGWVSVQDISAQQAVPLLLDNWLPGKVRPRILDACAAPGGKTSHLLEYANDLQLDVLEIDKSRITKIKQNLQRLGLTACILQGDASQPQDWWNGQLYDAILLDAPCSASGVVRRHPDILWLKKPQDIINLQQTQQLILQKLWALLKEGGRLLYCTCSIFKLEGQQQIENFMALTTNARVLFNGYILPHSIAQAESNLGSYGAVAGGDGFFYALLEKSSC